MSQPNATPNESPQDRSDEEASSLTAELADQIELLADLEPVEAAELASRIADRLATALDEEDH